MLSTRDEKALVQIETPKFTFDDFREKILLFLDQIDQTNSHPEYPRDSQVYGVFQAIFDELFRKIEHRGEAKVISARHLGDLNSVLFFFMDFSGKELHTLKEELNEKLATKITVSTLEEFWQRIPADTTDEEVLKDTKSFYNEVESYFFRRQHDNNVFYLQISVDNIFSLIWPSIIEKLTEKFTFPFVKVSHTFRELYANRMINYRSAKPWPEFLLTDLVVRSRFANQLQEPLSNAFQSGFKGKSHVFDIINSYLHVKNYSEQQILLLESAKTTAEFAAAGDVKYVLTLPPSIDESHLEIVTDHLNALQPDSSHVKASDEKGFDEKRWHGISIKNSVLLNNFFIANMREAIKTHPQLVDKYREITLCFPLYSRLNSLAQGLAYDKKLNDEKDLIDESTRTAHSYGYKKITNPHALNIMELRNILHKNGMQDENPLRKLVLDIKAGDKENTEKYKLSVTESLSALKKATENRVEILKKYSSVVDPINASAPEEVKHLSQKEIFNMAKENINQILATPVPDDVVGKRAIEQMKDIVLPVLQLCINACESEDVCAAHHKKAEQDLVVFGEYSSEIMKIITQLEEFFDRKFLKGRTDFPDEDAIKCEPW